jgi:SAM-dependent methyltransferase
MLPPGKVTSASYDCVANEYYDSVLHPTCFNFGELSKRAICLWLDPGVTREKDILEVGAGRSIAAQLMISAGCRLDRLFLLDKSPAMLAYSRGWADDGAKLLIADARSTSLQGNSFDLIIASLGDPYNQLEFWNEVARLLRPNGLCLFTTPTYEWARLFRKGSMTDEAEFLLQDGTIATVPSFIPSNEIQLKMLADAGLEKCAEVDFFRKDLTHSPSPKIMIFKDTDESSIVRGLMVRKALTAWNSANTFGYSPM